MAQPATVLILADIDGRERADVEASCVDAGFLPIWEPSSEAAISKLTGKRFDALVVHLGTPGAALACMRARGKLLRVRIPVIALVDGEDDAGFARAYRAGADEVLTAGRSDWLAARLRALPKPSIPQPGNSRGDAVVADADRTRAEVLERVLRDAGFRVEVAVDGFSTRLQAGRPSLKVAVVDASLDDVPSLIAQARLKGARCAWVVRARPEQLDELRQRLVGESRVAVVSAYGPPDDVLFETNRLLEPKPEDGRADARLLYGTILKLKWGNGGAADVGYTYNVSSVGLFVRTLVPPTSDTVEIEVTPPGADGKVRLECKVAWRREFGTTRKEPVPAGFGVQVIGGDADAWAEACPRVPSVRKSMPAGESVPAPRPSRSGTLRGVVGQRLSSPVPARPSDVPIRAQQSSVEEMLASVLSETIPDEDAVGSAPLSIDGDSVVEVQPAAVATPVPPPSSEKPRSVPPPMAPPDEAPAREMPPASDITPASLGFDLFDDLDVPELPAAAEPKAPEQPTASDRPTAIEHPAPPAPRKSTTEVVDPGAKTQALEAVSLADTLPPETMRLESAPPPAREPSSRPPGPRLRSDRPLSSVPPIPKSGFPPIAWVAIAVVLGGGLAIVVAPSRNQAPAVAVSAPMQATSLPVAPSETAPPQAASAEIARAPSALPAASVDAPPAPAPSEAPAPASATAAPSAAPPESEFDATSLASLKHGTAFLYVASELSTNVYVYGLLAGKTNERIVTKCGPRFIRLGTSPGAWQGEGVVQIVKCGALTRVEMSGK